MASFDYRLNPLYPIKECSSCEALYTTDYCCSDGSLGDKIICDLDKTPNLSQRSPQNCPKCGNPVDGHYCQGCALLRKKFKEDLFTSCVENGILQDSSKPSNDNTNVVNALQEPSIVNQDPGRNSSQSPPQINHHCCYGCVLIVPNPKPFNNQTIKELPPTVPSFDPTCYSKDGNSFTYDPKSNLVQDSPNVFDPPAQLPLYSCEFYRNDTRYGHYCTPQVLFIYPKPCYSQDFNFPQNFHDFQQQYLCCENYEILACYDDDDDDYTIAITHKEPNNSLSMGDEHLYTVSAMKSDEFIKSSVENLVQTQLFSDKDIPKEIYSNPLFDEEITSMKIDPHHFNVESDLIESLLNHDSSIISSSSKIDSLFDEFTGELTILKLIPSRINETDCDLEEDSNSLMEENDLTFTLDDLMPPGIKEDDYDFEKDILILEELISNDSLSFPKNESFHFDIPSSSRPPAKPPDGNTGILNVKVMGDISEHNVPMPRLMSTLVPNQEKSLNLLSHPGHEAFQLSSKCPMMIYGRNTHILDVSLFHFYPP
nr:hypothetical protein [Tanacetum cinerariifolium]